MSDSQIRSVVEEVVRQQLGSDHVVTVGIARDTDDFEDEDVLWVTVVVENATTDRDMINESGLVRHLRPRLEALGETAFPVISFLSRQESEAVA